MLCCFAYLIGLTVAQPNTAEGTTKVFLIHDIKHVISLTFHDEMKTRLNLGDAFFYSV